MGATDQSLDLYLTNGVGEVGNVRKSHPPVVAALLLTDANGIGRERGDTTRERVG